MDAVPAPWLELLRKQPVLWMVVTPVVLATLLIVIAVALAPEVEKARPEPLARARTVSPPSASPTAASEEPSPAPPAPDGAAVAALESKSPDTLSVEEVLLVKQHRAEQKRNDAQGLATKLLQQPDLAKDAAVQRELLRLVADPDTAELALTALARTPSAVAKDLLYDVTTSRAVPVATSELAASLLSSRDVRANASPALVVALELRAASSCEAIRAALPKAQSEGDRRSLSSLGKLNSRRGCGADKTEDCYGCLRSQMKQVTATINAVKRRKAPSSVPY
ncbi:MAG: hypothetical protein K0R38_2475 [Polyangiaceae bacterium]|nr:hypothetical protein [Polyangiaceae bacterium]